MIKIIITLLTCINFTSVMAANNPETLVTPSIEILSRTYTIKKEFYNTQGKDLENILNYKGELTTDDISLSKTEITSLETHHYLFQLIQEHSLEHDLKRLSKNPLWAYYIVEPFGQSYLDSIKELEKIVKIYPRPNIWNSEEIKEKILAVIMGVINLNESTCPPLPRKGFNQ